MHFFFGEERGPILFVCFCFPVPHTHLQKIAAFFYTCFFNTLFQAGAWISTILWIVLITMCAITLWRAGVMPWMIKNPASSSAPTNQQVPTNHQVPQISTLAADTYQPTAMPGKTFETTTDNPYEPDF